MTEVKVLIEGYAKETPTGWIASSTTTLIKENGLNILVDPGCNKKLLLEKLEEEKLTTDDIDIVFLTHFHLDHIMLVGIFERAKVMDGTTIYEGDKETEYEGKIPGTTIIVIPTPGHAGEHTSLIMETDKGIVVVAADLFWWMDNEEQNTSDTKLLLHRSDPFTNDEFSLKENRKKILARAGWIIPGHGKMFKNPKINDRSS
jgi:glyoxylase-like metal-dependent hydrolase (beta-lactamase superfamily II)